MKILITGSSGVLGSLLAKELEKKGHLVVRVSLKQSNFIHSYTWEDLDSSSIVKDIDVVCHCAFSRTQSPRELAQSILLSKKIFSWSLSNGVNKLINVSSQSIYGNFRKSPSKETDAVAPFDFYGLAKVACEELAESILNNKIDYINVRLASLIGPNFPERVVFKMLNNAYSKGIIHIYGGDQLYSYLDIRDAVDGLINVIERKEPYEKQVYNLGSNEVHTLEEVAHQVVKSLEDNTDFIKINIIKNLNKSESNKMPLNCESFFKDFSWHPRHTLKDSITYILKSKIKENDE